MSAIGEKNLIIRLEIVDKIFFINEMFAVSWIVN